MTSEYQTNNKQVPANTSLDFQTLISTIKSTSLSQLVPLLTVLPTLSPPQLETLVQTLVLKIDASNPRSLRTLYLALAEFASESDSWGLFQRRIVQECIASTVESQVLALLVLDDVCRKGGTAGGCGKAR